ncbi:MAG: endonuclease III domain-containing protein [Desulfomonilaceae bacterium]
MNHRTAHGQLGEICVIGKKLTELYQRLFGRFGHRNWWPANSSFEVCVGAILTQNTSWKNVEKAIGNLKNAGRLEAFQLYGMPVDELAALIRPAGYFNVKSQRLKNFVSCLVERYNGSLEAMFESDVHDLRLELLSINGIGRETADSMILYAANKPIFVVDVYTRRVLERHNIVGPKTDYDSIRELFETNLERDVAFFNDCHAQFVAVGSRYCGRKPRCSGCPLEGFNNLLGANLDS